MLENHLEFLNTLSSKEKHDFFSLVFDYGTNCIEHQKRLAEYSQNIGIWNWEIDKDAKVKYSNIYCENIIGYSPDEITSQMRFYDFFGGTEVEKQKQLFQQAINQKNRLLVFQFDLKNKDFDIIRVLCLGFPIINEGNLEGFYGINIAESKLNKGFVNVPEGSLELQTMQHLFPDLSFVGVLLLQNNTIIDSNKLISSLLGYERNELVGKKITDIFLLEKNIDEFELIQNIGNTERFEITACKKDGIEIIVEVEGRTIINEDSKIQALAIRDITEKKKYERDLLESEYRFKALHNASFGGITIHDKGLILECNKGLSTITGYTYDELIGMDGLKLINDETRPIVVDKINSHSEKPYEAVGVRKNGEEYPIRLEAKEIPYKGKIVRVVEFRDITDIKKAEEDLRKSKELMAKMIANHGDVIAIIDKNGINTFKSINVEKQFGWKPSELVGESALDKVHPDDKRAASDFLNSLFLTPGKTGQIEFRYQHKTKGYRWIDFFATNLIDDHDVNGILGNYKDIHERVIAQNRLKENEKKIRYLLDNIKAGVVVYNKNTEIIFANEEASVLLGLNLDEMYGKPAIDENWSFINENGGKMQQDDFPVHQVLRKKEPVQDLLVGISRPKTKDVCWVVVNAFPEYDSNGEISQVVSTFIDITERKNAEQIVIESQRLGAIGEMSSAVAHDFNNSLQSIFGNLELAMLRLGNNHIVNSYLQTVKMAAEDAAKRVQLLQRFSGKGQDKRVYQKLSINHLIKEVIVQTRPIWKDRAQHNGIEINIINKVENNLYGYGDVSEIRSVLFNIIKNSVEAMPQGGDIIIESGIQYEESKKMVFIRIKDQGLGMSQETKQRIFQPFYTTKGFESGRGMGLAGAYSIMKEHLGSIYVEDTSEEAGTTIVVCIPVNNEDQQQNEEKPIPNLSNTFKSVLWVDDELSIRKNAPELLSFFNLPCETAEDGKVALRMLSEKKYDLIFTDIGMPGLSGWELLSEARKIYRDDVSIIITTGWGNEVTKRQYKERGANAILTKPFSISDIKKLLIKLDEKMKEG